MTPMWAKPLAAPPPSTRPITGLALATGWAATGGSAMLTGSTGALLRAAGQHVRPSSTTGSAHPRLPDRLKELLNNIYAIKDVAVCAYQTMARGNFHT